MKDKSEWQILLKNHEKEIEKRIVKKILDRIEASNLKDLYMTIDRIREEYGLPN